KRGASRAVMIASVAGNLALLGTFKYAGGPLGLALPIGISFYTFQTMSYTIDVYRGEVKPQRNFISFAAYVTMFPQLIAGPIVRYRTVEKQLESRALTVDKFADGVRRFIVGLAKKVMLANMAGKLWEYALASPANERTALMCWLGAVGFAFQIYFDFSGYSDMAIGLGKMFGFDYDENFRYPYMQKSITGFWRTWHISLGTWFREYVYIPLGGNKKGVPRQLLNILAVWGLTGIWHGASWNFLVWGLYFAFFLIMEKMFLGRALSKAPSAVGHIYMLLVVVVGWVIFAVEDFGSMGAYLSGMLGAGGLAGTEALYALRKYAPLFVLFAVGCTDLPARLANKFIRGARPLVRAAASNIFLIVVFLVCVGLIVGDSYNPFLYFRF
ncbi:MAG: MBOAT family protein, partial [Butyrivibrio sp.]|nr:MBOAT family protein [Butyrivibrio sp.]